MSWIPKKNKKMTHSNKIKKNINANEVHCYDIKSKTLMSAYIPGRWLYDECPHSKNASPDYKPQETAWVLQKILLWYRYPTR